MTEDELAAIEARYRRLKEWFENDYDEEWLLDHKVDSLDDLHALIEEVRRCWSFLAVPKEFLRALAEVTER